MSPRPARSFSRSLCLSPAVAPLFWLSSNTHTHTHALASARLSPMRLHSTSCCTHTHTRLPLSPSSPHFCLGTLRTEDFLSTRYWIVSKSSKQSSFQTSYLCILYTLYLFILYTLYLYNVIGQSRWNRIIFNCDFCSRSLFRDANMLVWFDAKKVIWKKNPLRTSFFWIRALGWNDRWNDRCTTCAARMLIHAIASAEKVCHCLRIVGLLCNSCVDTVFSFNSSVGLVLLAIFSDTR